MIEGSGGEVDRFVVFIIGGGFAGSSSGLLLNRFAPEARVLILERATAF
jgi:L-2-hydroxyglutarate oxidase LhgO